MLDFGPLQSNVMLVLTAVLFLVKVVAMVDCVMREPRRFAQIETLPKNTWLVILGVALVVHLVQWHPLGLFNLVGTVAALVYLAQVRSVR